MLEDILQVGDVAERIAKLLVRQRPAAPVREARRLVDLRADDALGEIAVAHRLAEPAHHRRHLGVEDRVRNDAGPGIDDLDVLPARMEHLERAGIGHQIEERLQVDAGSQRVDDQLLLGAGHLDEAQFRPEGLLAQELRVDRQVGMLCEGGAGIGELLSGLDYKHRCGIYPTRTELCQRQIAGKR